MCANMFHVCDKFMNTVQEYIVNPFICPVCVVHVHDIGGTFYDTCTSIFTEWTYSTNGGICAWA